MKPLKIFTLILAGMLGFVISCKDDKELVPVWETGVTGEGTITGAAKDFKRGDQSVQLDVDLKWISVEGKTTVTKMEVFVLFKENYMDSDGNPAVANHGGDGGRLLTSFDGGVVPPNRTPVSFSITQTDVYNLYKDITYDYGDGNGAVSVFDNPFNPGRDAVNRFAPEDKLTVIWRFTSEDGRVFSAWSPSVCTEFPGSNCSIDFSVVCAEEISSPGANGGIYEIAMTDTYGDGWNGAAIRVIIDGVATEHTLLAGSSGVTTITVPPTASALFFEFVSGAYDSEVIFTIKSPKGNIIASAGPSPAEGPIKLNLCKE